MQWKLNSGAPIYAQLVDQMKLRIIMGVYPSGSRIPPVRELAMEAGVNPNTMQRAMQELERQGLVFSHRTSGRFVTEDEAVIRGARDVLAENYVNTFVGQMFMLGYSMEEIVTTIERREKT